MQDEKDILMLFGAAYYPEHRDPSKWEHDLDLMREAYVNCLRVGEFAWAKFEPEDERYSFSWMDSFMEKAFKRGIRMLMCPPLRTLPAWLVAKEPGVRLETQDGTVFEFGSRYSFCINHPVLLEKGVALAEAMARHYGPSEAIAGWHLDNEHGDEPDCHCPICARLFREWCRRNYSSLEDLNEKWGLEFWGLLFSDWSQIPTPRVSKTFHSPGHLLAWRRFRSESTVSAVELQAASVRKFAGEGQLITTNNQTWNPRSDYYEMAKSLDLTGTNYYPPYGPKGRDSESGLALCHSYKQANFHVHELRNGAHMIPGHPDNTPAPGEVEKLTLSCVGNGADGIFYFRWRACPFGCEQSHGTVTDYDGRPKRIYSEVKSLGAKLKELAPLLDGRKVESQVAVLNHFPSRWAMETDCYWNGPKWLYETRLKALYLAVRKLGFNCGFAGADQDFSKYKVLIVPALPVVDDALARKLADFVEGGGTLVWHPLSGVKDADARIYPDRIHPLLRKFAGANLMEFATLGEKEDGSFEWNGKAYKASLFCELPELEGAEALCRYSDKWYGGAPAVWRKRSGKGSFIFVGTFPEASFYKDFLSEILSEAGVARWLKETPPELVAVTERLASDGKRLVFLINHSEEAQKVRLPRKARDVYNGADMGEVATLPPFGAMILSAE